MQISGITDEVYIRMAPYIRLYIRYKQMKSTTEAAEIIDYIDRHYDEIERAYSIIGKDARGGTHKSITLHSIVATAIICAVYRGENMDALRRFVNVYRNNNIDKCEKYNPRHALNVREYVRGRSANPEMLRRCECAIYSFAHNQTQMKMCDRYPYQPAMDA